MGGKVITNQRTAEVERLREECVKLLIRIDDWKARFWTAVLVGIAAVCAVTWYALAYWKG